MAKDGLVEVIKFYRYDKESFTYFDDNKCLIFTKDSGAAFRPNQWIMDIKEGQKYPLIAETEHRYYFFHPDARPDYVAWYEKNLDAAMPCDCEE